MVWIEITPDETENQSMNRHHLAVVWIEMPVLRNLSLSRLRHHLAVVWIEIAIDTFNELVK